MTWRPSSGTRRGFLAALLGGGTAAAALSPADVLLGRAAPLSGRTWHAERTVPDTVESPYGPASVTYDDHHVPHVEADGERAAYYALGYVQAADRLFEMDLFRRIPAGRLSAVTGDASVEQDVLFTKLGFREAAAASAQAIEGTDVGAVMAAFAAGVTAFLEENEPGVPFGLLGYEPDEWTVVDSMLVGKFISWQISGSFAPLRTAVKRRAFDAETVRQLYPRRHDHDAPILREGRGGRGAADIAPTDVDRSTANDGASDSSAAVDTSLVDLLETVEPPRRAGSNAWVIAGEHTDSGRPLVCSDPHLMLQAPPVWYEQQFTVGDATVRGIAIPGTASFAVGENDHGSWAMTAGQISQADLYTFETDGDRYRYRGEWREFDSETRTVEVAGGEDREVTVRRTVHGPYLDRAVGGEIHNVAVGWVGLAGTRDPMAYYRMARSTGVDEFRDALALLDAPTLNFYYADEDGRTLYQTAGRVPIRRVDGEPVPGDTVFDGSAGEGEWEGFEPFGHPSWDGGGFVPFEALPAAVDPDYVAGANQRIVDDPAYPLGSAFAEGFRAERLYERLDETVGEGDAVGLDFCESLQLDTLDPRARELVPALLAVRERVDDDVASWLDELEGWDYRLDRDSAAALVFQRTYRQFRAETWAPLFEAHDLGERYWPSERVLLGLPADSEYFDGDRGDVLARAATAAVAEIEDEGWSVYGDYNTTAIDHLFGGLVSGMNYPDHAADGDWSTVRSFSKANAWGASYRLVSAVGGETRTVLPGGNDGSPLSDHYHDQLRMWVDGEYRTASDDPDGGPDITFEGATDDR